MFDVLKINKEVEKLLRTSKQLNEVEKPRSLLARTEIKEV
jgi:hypothetical protein